MSRSLLVCGLALIAMAVLSRPSRAEDCPAGTHFVDGLGCAKNATEIEFEGSDVSASGFRPGVQLVMEHRVASYPCDELRQPGKLDAWELCLRNYYGTAEIAEISYSIASRFVETQACPQDEADITTLEEIAKHYAAHPKNEDLTDLQVPPLDPSSANVEPHLPIMCGYSASQRRWYDPRNFYCQGTDCFPQSTHGAKDHVRYTPIGSIPNLMKVVAADDVRPVGDGGSYGYLRIIPLGNEVFLVTSGGMYGNVYYYGLVMVPHEELLLHRACDRETAALAPTSSSWRRSRLLSAARRIEGQAQALLDVRRIATALARPDVPSDDRERMLAEAWSKAEILRGIKAADPIAEEPCVRFQARYPHQFERARNTLGRGVE